MLLFSASEPLKAHLCLPYTCAFPSCLCGPCLISDNGQFILQSLYRTCAFSGNSLLHLFSALSVSSSSLLNIQPCSRCVHLWKNKHKCFSICKGPLLVCTLLTKPSSSKVCHFWKRCIHLTSIPVCLKSP